jgi:5-methylcytosine-specific restriction endonuclease McrA
MNFGFHPAPKTTYPKGKKKKLETYKGRAIPKAKDRGKISKTDYQKVIDEHGFSCWFCGSEANLECHHVVPKGFSKVKSGRGVWTNLRFLCSEHHRGKTGVHQNKKLMQKLQYEHEKLYSQHFYKDRFDLFKEGLIPTPTKEVYESFMSRGLDKCLKKEELKKLANNVELNL